MRRTRRCQHFSFLAVVVSIGMALALRAEARECLVAVDSESDQLIVVDATDLTIRNTVRLRGRIAVNCGREAGYPGLGASRIDAIRETGVVAVSTGTCVIELFDTRTGYIGTFNIGHPLDRTAVRFSRDGSYLAVANTAPGSERGGVSLVDMQTHQVREVSIPGLAPDGFLVEHPDGSFYAHGRASVGIHRVDPTTGESSPLPFADGFKFWTVAVSPDGRWLFANASAADSALFHYSVFDLRSGEIVESHDHAAVYSGPDRDRVYLASGDEIEIVDARTRLLIDELSTMGLRVLDLVFSEDESRMFGIIPITDRATPHVRIAAFDLESGSVRTVSTAGDHCGRFHASPKISSNPSTRCIPTQMTVVRCSCPTDCNDDNRVTIDELVIGVNLALSGGSNETCSAADLDRDGEISVPELISGVRAALNGCG